MTTAVLVRKLLTSFVAFTHSDLYMSFIIIHAPPLAAAIVLGFRTWWAFVFAATIGIWKDGWLDVKYGNTTYMEAAIAQSFYLLGAFVGAFGCGLFP